MTETLKPCPIPNTISPHSGRPPVVHDGMPGRGYRGNEWIAGCEDCDLWTPQFLTREEAILAWNTRAAGDVADYTERMK